MKRIAIVGLFLSAVLFASAGAADEGPSPAQAAAATQPASAVQPVGASAPKPAPTTADGRSTEFRAVEGGNQLQSGEKLLVEAYAAMWLLIFAFVLMTWRRQAKTDERIANLEDAVTKARAEASKASRAEREARAVKAAEVGDA